jgi:hypothetical protein
LPIEITEATATSENHDINSTTVTPIIADKPVLPRPTYIYDVVFKAINHNTLVKNDVYKAATSHTPAPSRQSSNHAICQVTLTMFTSLILAGYLAF